VGAACVSAIEGLEAQLRQAEQLLNLRKPAESLKLADAPPVAPHQPNQSANVLVVSSTPDSTQDNPSQQLAVSHDHSHEALQPHAVAADAGVQTEPAPIEPAVALPSPIAEAAVASQESVQRVARVDAVSSSEQPPALNSAVTDDSKTDRAVSLYGLSVFGVLGSLSYVGMNCFVVQGCRIAFPFGGIRKQSSASWGAAHGYVDTVPSTPCCFQLSFHENIYSIAAGRKTACKWRKRYDCSFERSVQISNRRRTITSAQSSTRYYKTLILPMASPVLPARCHYQMPWTYEQRCQRCRTP